MDLQLADTQAEILRGILYDAALSQTDPQWAKVAYDIIAKIEEGQERGNVSSAARQLPDGEYHCQWTCPKCGHFQHDSVHSEDGPWFTATCGKCGGTFGDNELSDVDQASWEVARDAADQKSRRAPPWPI